MGSSKAAGARVIAVLAEDLITHLPRQRQQAEAQAPIPATLVWKVNKAMRFLDEAEKDLRVTEVENGVDRLYYGFPTLRKSPPQPLDIWRRNASDPPARP